MTESGFSVRPARTSDVGSIRQLVEPLVQRRILLGKDAVVFYEAIQEFRVAVDADGNTIGCGALHVMWEDLAEVRTLAVVPQWLRKGVGHTLLTTLETDALELGLSRLFCLTFETEFFERHGFAPMGERTVEPDVYSEMLRSPDEGVAEFLDLARVKPNTLGNTRMLKLL
jgi:amino-acid N-acetyltransferase